jgi:LysR family transcriptional regulator, benzoate and cis,cis-muconate-responsive activator of ben and cat genes
MELRHLKYFVAVAEERNISRGALKLNISQPAVSRSIRELECELGANLFIRERFGLSLTAEGEQFLERSRKILEDCAEAVKVVSKTAELPQKLDIGFITSALESFLGNALKKFYEHFPEIEIRVHDMPPGDQIIALRNQQVDLAFVGNPYQELEKEFSLHVVKEIRLQAALPTSHRHSSRNVIELKELREDIFIGLDEKKFPGRNQTIIKACESDGFKPTLRYEALGLIEVLGMVGAGMGVCLMPSDVANLPHPNVVFLSLSNDNIEPIRLEAAWLPGNKNAAIQLLLKFLEL